MTSPSCLDKCRSSCTDIWKNCPMVGTGVGIVVGTTGIVAAAAGAIQDVAVALCATKLITLATLKKCVVLKAFTNYVAAKTGYLWACTIVGTSALAVGVAFIFLASLAISSKKSDTSPVGQKDDKKVEDKTSQS